MTICHPFLFIMVVSDLIVDTSGKITIH